MRPTLILPTAALFALTGCIEEPTRVVPVGGPVEAHGDMDHHDGDHTASGDMGAAVTAVISELDGSGVSGTVTFTETAGDLLRVEYAITGLQPGPHGFHVHENGSCAAGDDGTPGGAAGGHFNPGGDPHGGPEAGDDARHDGDFGNIMATERGLANGSFTDDVARLMGAGGISGKALMIHAGEDDLQSQPSGDAGGRVGCGVIGG